MYAVVRAEELRPLVPAQPGRSILVLVHPDVGRPAMIADPRIWVTCHENAATSWSEALSPTISSQSPWVCPSTLSIAPGSRSTSFHTGINTEKRVIAIPPPMLPPARSAARIGSRDCTGPAEVRCDPTPSLPEAKGWAQRIEVPTSRAQQRRLSARVVDVARARGARAAGSSYGVGAGSMASHARAISCAASAMPRGFQWLSSPSRCTPRAPIAVGVGLEVGRRFTVDTPGGFQRNGEPVQIGRDIGWWGYWWV